jgi:hypothetical protein
LEGFEYLLLFDTFFCIELGFFRKKENNKTTGLFQVIMYNRSCFDLILHKGRYRKNCTAERGGKMPTWYRLENLAPPEHSTLSPKFIESNQGIGHDPLVASPQGTVARIR